MFVEPSGVGTLCHGTIPYSPPYSYVPRPGDPAVRRYGSLRPHTSGVIAPFAEQQCLCSRPPKYEPGQGRTQGGGGGGRKGCPPWGFRRRHPKPIQKSRNLCGNPPKKHVRTVKDPLTIWVYLENGHTRKTRLLLASGTPLNIRTPLSIRAPYAHQGPLEHQESLGTGPFLVWRGP